MTDHCPHCLNTVGFVFGTCTVCGFNYIDNTFHFVKTWEVGALPDWMIEEHAARTKNQCHYLHPKGTVPTP